MATRKRLHPGNTPPPDEEGITAPSKAPDADSPPNETSQETASEITPPKSKRLHPGNTQTDAIQAKENETTSSSRSPLSEEEWEIFEETTTQTKAPSKGLETPPFLKRTLVFLLLVGFSLLGFFILLQTIQAIGTIMVWPPWLAWPLLTLIFAAISYVLVRLGLVLVRLRKLPQIYRESPADPRNRTAAECRALRDQLCQHLKILGSQKLAAKSSLANDANILIESADEMPFTAWLDEYIHKIQQPLVAAAKQDVHKIALAAGVSAAFSPWRLLDTLIAFNASIEAAQCTLRRFGIRPDTSATVAFAFDTFLTTFFAAAVDEMTEDMAQDLSERLGGEFGGKAVGLLGPKIAQGLGIAYFVRRLGRRMIRRLEAVRL